LQGGGECAGAVVPGDRVLRLLHPEREDIDSRGAVVVDGAGFVDNREHVCGVGLFRFQVLCAAGD